MDPHAKIQPFKKYREMDDEQRQKISQSPNLHRAKSEETRKKISATMKARWAATPHKPITKIEDIMLECDPPVRITEEVLRRIVTECIKQALTKSE